MTSATAKIKRVRATLSSVPTMVGVFPGQLCVTESIIVAMIPTRRIARIELAPVTYSGVRTDSASNKMLYAMDSSNAQTDTTNTIARVSQ